MSTEPIPPLLTAEQKHELTNANRAALERDLADGRLIYESKPRTVEWQFSNFCNMSCTMCYDGENPPMKKMPELIVERLAEELLPTATVVQPFFGSEPLIITWDLARDLAHKYRVELDIVTNLQFLDEAKFKELEPLVSSITFSIDSHIEGVFDRIRLRGNTQKVFRNLPIAAKLCFDHGIETEVNMVFMTENAAFLDESVAFFADAGVRTVRILKYIDIAPDREMSDAFRTMRPEWIEDMKQKMVRVAEEKKINLVFVFEGLESHDFREINPISREDCKKDPWLERLRGFYPGYCWQSVNWLRVDAGGESYPCCVAMDDELMLGNISETSVEEVWNGPEAQDLRRAMMTGDLPAICKSCPQVTGHLAAPQEHLPFVDEVAAKHLGGDLLAGRWTLEVLGPEHLARETEPPKLSWTAPTEAVDFYVIAFGVGGDQHEDNLHYTLGGDTTDWQFPRADWAGLLPNIAYWWTVWGVVEESPASSVRAESIRCVRRHEALPRVAGSTLRY